MPDISPLRRGVLQVERRLFVRRVLAVWPWCATVSLGVAALLVVVNRYRPLGIVATSTLLAATGVSIAAALAWAWLRRDDATAAAVELDRRCGLAERVSSAMALGATASDDPPAAEAVRLDAERALARVNVAASFPLAPSRRAAWPLPAAVGLAACALLLAPRDPVVDPAAAAVAEQAQVKESAEALAKKLAEKQRTAESLKLTEAHKLLEKLQEETQRLQADRQLDRKEALVKLNDLAEQLEDRRRAVGGAEELKKQLSRLRSKHSGPADKLAQSLGKGDYRGASDQLQQLRKQLEARGLDDKQKEQLAKQLDDLQRQLDDLAKKQEERRREAEQQLAQGLKSKKSGGDAGASAEKLAELSQAAAGAAAEDEQLQQLQRALESAVDNLKQARGDEAGQALDDLQQQLDVLAAQNDEMQLLDGGLQDLAECKAGCCRGDGQGTGQAASNGGAPGDRQGQGGQNQQARAGQGGTKPGVGTARNENPTDADDKNAFDSRVRTEIGDAAALRVVGPTDGPNAKGRALQAIREQAAALAEGGEPQPVANQPLDRSRRDQKRQYFDALRQAD
jgi:hypothetical protein